MAYFKNAVCPVCEKPLNEEDDIVVCPECGAPYHRSCYKETGRCLYADKHGTDFCYLPDPKEEEDTPSEGFVICPHCHKGNPAGSEVCENCGSALPASEVQQKAKTADVKNDMPAYRRPKEEVNPDTEKFRPTDDGTIHLEDPSEDPMEELKAQLNQNEKMDGFTLKEWLCYLGPSGPLYLFQFKRMDEMRRGRPFSLSAALFAPLYFLYRKMWGWGILSLLGKLLCAAPSILSVLYSQQLISFLPFSAQLLDRFSLYGMYLDIALSLFWALSAYTLYRGSCIRNMSRIKKHFETAAVPIEGSADGLYLQYAHKGGVSVTAVAVLAGLALILYLPMVFYFGL